MPRKSTMPMPVTTGGSGGAKKLVGIVLLLALLVLVVKHPTEAAGFAKSVGGFIEMCAEGIAGFLSQLS
ncbi:hypothetical protein [Saccharomonospora piscinae]|uniref:hypothetical protein n=1 Tax=Saccharomonospora piscinae TaxID=687388 RepID=UPI000464CD12|nr:hypothetical protein [Saccharomonospora piscinae]